jgi:hypothetical protein
MKLLRFLEGALSRPRRLLDEEPQSPAATLLRAARMNGPPPPEGAKERAMAALGRAVAESSRKEQEQPPRRPRRWARIVQGVAIAAAAAMVPLWMSLRQPEKGEEAMVPAPPYPASAARPTPPALQPSTAPPQRLDPEPLVIRQPRTPGSGVEPVLVVRLDCGDARRLVRPVDIVYPREAVAAGVESDMLVSCNVSDEGAFYRCRVLQAPANAKIDAAEVLRSVGTWRYPIAKSERALVSSTCTVRIELQLQGR